MKRAVLLCRAEMVLLIAGSLLLGAAGLNLLRYRLFEELRDPFAAHVVPAMRTDFGALSVAGKLEVPRLGLSVLVVDGDEEQGLGVAAVHLTGTAQVGGLGNAVIAGHRDTAFWPLRNLKIGDRLQIRTADRVYRYQANSIKVVSPDDLTVLNNQSSPMVTLITCYPFRYVGNAPKRFVVQAKLVTD